MHIRLAWPWEGPDGTTHQEGTFLEVPVAVGRDLVRRGLATKFDSPEAADAAIAETKEALAGQQAAAADAGVTVLFVPPEPDPEVEAAPDVPPVTTDEVVTSTQDDPAPAVADSIDGDLAQTDPPVAPAEAITPATPAAPTPSGKSKPRPGQSTTPSTTTPGKEA